MTKRAQCIALVLVLVVAGASCNRQVPRRPILPPLPSSKWRGVCDEPSRRFTTAEGLGPAPTPSLKPPDSAMVWPTNQWWTSLLTKPDQPVWVQPVAVRFGAAGMALSVRPPTASNNAVITPFEASLTMQVKRDSTAVAQWGDFHVVVNTMAQNRPTSTVTLAQGSPAVWVEMRATGPIGLQLPVGGDVRAAGKSERVEIGGKVTTSNLRVELRDGLGWNLVTTAETVWTRSADGVVASFDDGEVLGVVARPVNAASGWDSAAQRTGSNPVVDTVSEWRINNNEVRQRLVWKRRSPGAGLVGLRPHHVLGRRGSKPSTLGSFETARGPIAVESATSVEWAAPLNDIVLNVPDVALTTAERTDVVASLSDEVAALPTWRTSLPAGSYTGPKRLGRLATLVDVARRFDPDGSAPILTAELATATQDWLTYSGAGDARWLGYDERWGGLLASTPEFGHEDYNDHHFQYGYLIQAAASLAEGSSELGAAMRPMLNLIAADIGLGLCTDGFAPLRAMNPYEGHSYASGFAQFADGNNQESSSEAVHAWWSLMKWSAATGQTELTARALAFYAIEAATARTYWLGEGLERPAGYNHQVAGIVWGAKVDFATFFDARPASVVGIQLLPFTFGSLYRSNGRAAAQRYVDGSRDSGEHWRDLLLLDLAIHDPDRAAELLAETSVFEEGNSRAFALVWVAAQRSR